MGLHYLPNTSLTEVFFNKISASNNTFIHYFKNKFKILETKLILWIEDFYLGGN